MRGGDPQVPVVGVYLPLAGGTMTGNIQMLLNSLTTTNCLLRQYYATSIVIRDVTDTFFYDLDVGEIRPRNKIIMIGNGIEIETHNTDNYSFTLKARDTGIGLAEVARCQGAADPYFQMTLPPRLLPVATANLPATPLEGMIAYDDTKKGLSFRDNAAWRDLTAEVRVRKTADETVSNSIAVQDDNHLLLAMAANEVWQIDLFLIYSSSAVAGVRVDQSVPAGAVPHRVAPTSNSAGVADVDIYWGAQLLLEGIGATIAMQSARYVVVNGANAGNFQVRWAQVVAEVSNTIVYTNSCLICKKIA